MTREKLGSSYEGSPLFHGNARAPLVRLDLCPDSCQPMKSLQELDFVGIGNERSDFKEEEER